MFVRNFVFAIMLLFSGTIGGEISAQSLRAPSGPFDVATDVAKSKSKELAKLIVETFTDINTNKEKINELIPFVGEYLSSLNTKENALKNNPFAGQDLFDHETARLLASYIQKYGISDIEPLLRALLSNDDYVSLLEFLIQYFSTY